ncbi:MAG: hypothetical protein V3U99_08545 [Alphaproteobacteria bacterium]
MPSEFEDPRLAPLRARAVGRPQFLRWAMGAAAIGAVTSNLAAVLAAIGTAPADQAFPPPGAGEPMFVLQYLTGVAPLFVFIGGGLALAATVEVRRAAQEVASGTILAVWVTWALLALGAGGILFPAGNP